MDKADWKAIALIEIDILESIKAKHKGKTLDIYERRYSDVVNQLDRYMRW